MTRRLDSGLALLYCAVAGAAAAIVGVLVFVAVVTS